MDIIVKMLFQIGIISFIFFIFSILEPTPRVMRAWKTICAFGGLYLIWEVSSFFLKGIEYLNSLYGI